MLIDVLTRLSADTGMDLVNKRDALLRLANNGAKELHKRLETTAIFREVTLAVYPNKVVSLPAYVGDLRGMRIHSCDVTFDLHSLGNPRFVNNTQSYKINNWRDVGTSPVHTYLASAGPLTLTVEAPESTPITVTILGETDQSAEYSEDITISATTQTTTGNFAVVKSISCTEQRTYDIKVYDINAIEVAVLYNNQRQTRYKVVDVSQVFYAVDTTAGENFVDIMYKLPIVEFTRDADTFYGGDDFDEAWYNMCMFIWLKPMENRASDAKVYLEDALMTVKAAKQSAENGIVKRLCYGKNKFYDLYEVRHFVTIGNY
jgi:hypothetical protein